MSRLDTIRRRFEAKQDEAALDALDTGNPDVIHDLAEWRSSLAQSSSEPRRTQLVAEAVLLVGAAGYLREYDEEEL